MRKPPLIASARTEASLLQGARLADIRATDKARIVAVIRELARELEQAWVERHGCDCGRTTCTDPYHNRALTLP